MVSINPRLSQVGNHNVNRVSNNSSENQEKQKPTLQNMNDLYESYVSAQIIYCPAAALTESARKRTEALESYIKENNLDIDVRNLELFFDDFKRQYGNIGGMSGIDIKNKCFQNYIDNGYTPHLTGKTSLVTGKSISDEAKSLLNTKLELNRGKKSDVLKDYLDKLSDVEIEYQKNQSTVVELETNRAEADSINQIIRDNVERGFKFSG